MAAARTLHRLHATPILKATGQQGTSDGLPGGAAAAEEVVGVRIVAEGDGFLYNMVRIL